MSISTLPLGYCTNVHPGRSLAEVEEGIDRFTVPVQERVGGGVAAGLWLADPVVRELLARSDGPQRLADRLAQRGLVCYTLNAFPFGDFHGARVKDGVYLPDWSQPERLAYTWNCARALIDILPEGTDGSISTLPLGFKQHSRSATFDERVASQLMELAAWLSQMSEETQRVIRIAIEPEPFCLLETTAETIAFFERLFAEADRRGCGSAVREHIGICYDVCHQAVEFEDAAQAVQSIDAAGIRINKVQISCAIEVREPGQNVGARQALARFAEPRYLHQTFARHSTGEIVNAVDLTNELALDPPSEFRDAEMWRVHFHVPVDAESIGPLGTTRSELKRGLAAVAALSYAPHLEIETYTWEVLPGETPDIIGGLARELVATRSILEEDCGRHARQSVGQP